MTVNAKTFDRRSYLVSILVALFVVVIISASIALYALHHSYEIIDEDDKPMNVLFIVVDDLRPTLGCYGDNRAITPNIDQLAAKSIVFTNAFAQQALCAPSRTSFLTSRRPDSLHLYDNGKSYWREKIWNFTTMPEHFKNNGYETVSVGKIFHHGAVSNFTDDYPYSWTYEPYRPPTQDYKMDEVCLSADGQRYMNLICPVNVEDQPGKSLPDLQVADFATEYLLNKSSGPNKDQKFFLGVGFYKPHIPFKIPKEYLDLYPFESMDIAANNETSPDLPSVAWNPWTDLRERHDVQSLNVSFPYGPLPEDFQKRIRQGYYAAVSYMDDQVGKVLEALEKSGYASNTAIMLIGDHGWSLGEHGEWSKYSNFEVALKVPFILHVPRLTEKPEERKKFEYKPTIKTTKDGEKSLAPVRGKYVSEFFVELVDIFPTLAEIVGISIPSLCPLSENVTFCSEGVSLHPILMDSVFPAIEFSWKTAVFSQYPRPSRVPRNDSDQPKLKNIKIMGYTIRDEYFRYTRWVKFNNWKFVPHWGTFEGHELYDENQDPDEQFNLVDHPDYSNTVIHLFKRLKNGWRRELPVNVFGTLYSIKMEFNAFARTVWHNIIGLVLD